MKNGAETAHEKSARRGHETLLSKDQNGKKHKPGYSHSMPKPRGCIDGNLAIIDTLK